MYIEFFGTDHSGSGHFRRQYESKCGKYWVTVTYNSYTREYSESSNIGISHSEKASVTGGYTEHPTIVDWRKAFAKAANHTADGYQNGTGPHFVGHAFVK